MKIYSIKLTFFLLILFAVGITNEVCSQIAPIDHFPRQRDTDEEIPKKVTENIAKEQISRNKKEHTKLLERGDEALLLTEKIDTSLEKNGKFTAIDLANLERLEKVVEKIRNELGGGFDDEPDVSLQKELSKSPDLVDVFQYLRSTTVKLVTELKKTSRYSISAVVIQTSNSVIKIARFLRLRK